MAIDERIRINPDFVQTMRDIEDAIVLGGMNVLVGYENGRAAASASEAGSAFGVLETTPHDQVGKTEEERLGFLLGAYVERQVA